MPLRLLPLAIGPAILLPLAVYAFRHRRVRGVQAHREIAARRGRPAERAEFAPGLGDLLRTGLEPAAIGECGVDGSLLGWAVA